MSVVNYIHLLFITESGFTEKCINVDTLTYTGNVESLADIEMEYGGSRKGNRARKESSGTQHAICN